MKYELSAEDCHWQFIQRIESLSGQNISSCYQCGKCSAGCPIYKDMEVMPNQVMRYIQLGLKDQALINDTIRLCAGCRTCSIRCPQKLDLARVMDSPAHHLQPGCREAEVTLDIIRQRVWPKDLSVLSQRAYMEKFPLAPFIKGGKYSP